MQSDIVTGRAGRKRKDTERGGIERKRRDATSPLAAVAGGGTTARRATATGGTNTRRAKGARRVKRSARRSAQTKRTRRLWSSDCHLLVFLSCLSPVLSAPPSPPSPSPTKMRKKEREKMSTDPQNQEIAECSMPLAPPSISILLHPAVVRPHHHFMRRMDGSEDAGKEGQVSFTSSVFSPSPADISQGISLPFNPLLPLLPLSSAPPPSSQSTAVTVRSCSEISLYNQDDQQI